MYKAYITKLTNVRKHPNADRLLLGECFGNTVCVDLNAYEGQLGVYFPTDGQLSIEFATVNNLLRKKDAEGHNIGGYIDPDKRNVTAVRLRQEKSDGLFLPIACLNYCYEHGDASRELKFGDIIDSVVNGHDICCKYIPPVQKRSSCGGSKPARKRKVNIAPLFLEHIDTEQLAYNLDAFKPGDEIEITLKMHGSSQRTAYLPVLKEYVSKNPFWNYILHRNPEKMGKFAKKLYERALNKATPKYDWDYVSGTRRTVLDKWDGGFYGDNEFRKQHADAFQGKLYKGETVYYEVVGFTTNGTPIMHDGSNKGLDKNFIRTYGETTRFSYGCEPSGVKFLYGTDSISPFQLEINSKVPQSDCYVYRMTITNEDGEVVEYPPDFMRYRCEQMGVKTVPVMWRGIIPENPATADDPTISAGDWIKEKAELYYDGPDPIGKTHVREGVVVRITNRPKFTAYKHKNFSFKVIEGISKISADAPDMEEAQEVANADT